MEPAIQQQTIKDKAPKPAGLVPKNLQAFVLVGLALLMVLIMALTGHKRPAQPFPSSPYGTPVTSPNPNGAYPPGAYASALPQPVEGQPAADPLKDEQRKRQYVSL